MVAIRTVQLITTTPNLLIYEPKDLVELSGSLVSLLVNILEWYMYSLSDFYHS